MWGIVLEVALQIVICVCDASGAQTGSTKTVGKVTVTTPEAPTPAELDAAWKGWPWS